MSRPSPVGRRRDDPLVALGVRPNELSSSTGGVQFVRQTQYLNGAKAIVTHSVDDATRYVPPCLDAMDKYGIKATAFVNTRAADPSLWARLRAAVANGHEVGAHSRRHPCQFPETVGFCFVSVNRFEIEGSRDDILELTAQPYVWSWAYPCGNCARRRFVQRRVANAGFITARAYDQNFPDLRTFDTNPYAAGFTQAVQRNFETTWNGKKSTIPGRTDVPTLNAVFDEVYAAGGIYSFVSHPQWLDYGPESFYEQHLAHVGRRADVWYVPLGPLYAYRVLSQHTSVRQLTPHGARARFAVFHRLDPNIYNGSVTLAFHADAPVQPAAGGAALAERVPGPVQRWDDQYWRRSGDLMLLTIRPNAIVEFW